MDHGVFSQTNSYFSYTHLLLFSYLLELETKRRKKNYNSKREDIEEEDQREDERNVILEKSMS